MTTTYRSVACLEDEIIKVKHFKYPAPKTSVSRVYIVCVTCKKKLGHPTDTIGMQYDEYVCPSCGEVKHSV